MFTENLENTQHYDFSTASEWEIFIARLEEIILEWKLHLEKIGPPLKNNELTTGSWEIKTDSAVFADTEFVVNFYKLKQDESETILDNSTKFEVHEDLLSLENDFLSMMLCEDGSVKPHYVSRWYGLKKFIVLTPAKGSSILNESKIKILMSSMTIAVNNQNCEVPMFAQVLEPWQNYFVGVCEGRGYRSEFDMIHLKKIPPHCKYLSGLLNVFKSKIACPCTLDPIKVSARFSYQLKDFTQFEYHVELPDFHQQESSTTSLLEKLPFGTACEPISEMTMYATWPKLVETIVVDTESYSDLEPQQAPLWYLALKMTELPSSLLYDYLTEFLIMCSSTANMDELLGDSIQNQPHDARIGAQSRLKDLSSCSRHGQGPLPDDLLMPVLHYLFPDATQGSKNEYSESIGCQIIKQDDVTQEGLSGLKSCPPDGLVWRLAVCSAHALYSMGGARSFVHVWHEFVQELRYRWENSLRIPGVPATFPDLKTCLLNQKLQLLNCCIEKKIAREKAAKGELHQETDDEGEEEFYDCDEDDKIGGGPVYLPWNQPTGQLRKHSGYKLIETGAPLYIPVTQDPIPKTEDQIEEDAEFLLSLGTDAESSELRAKLMSASLLSDMESFKAANPGAVLEDFIRWYSPRDFIEISEMDQFGQKKGKLSARMQLPGNTWREVWQTAKPVPARRQRRLFDDTKEAEKILHLFSCHGPATVATLLLPALLHAALSRLLEAIHPVQPVTSLARLASHLIKRVEYATRCPDTEFKRYQDMISEIGHLEALVSQYHSLHHKLCPDSNDSSTQQFLADLVMNPASTMLVPEGPQGGVGKRVSQMFFEAQKVASMRLDAVVSSDPSFASQDPQESWKLSPSPFLPLPTPSCREFILRVVAPRPASSSRPTPHKMTALIYSPDSLLISGVFSQDTMFQ